MTRKRSLVQTQYRPPATLQVTGRFPRSWVSRKTGGPAGWRLFRPPHGLREATRPPVAYRVPRSCAGQTADSQAGRCPAAVAFPSPGRRPPDPESVDPRAPAEGLAARQRPDPMRSAAVSFPAPTLDAVERPWAGPKSPVRGRVGGRRPDPVSCSYPPTSAAQTKDFGQGLGRTAPGTGMSVPGHGVHPPVTRCGRVLTGRSSSGASGGTAASATTHPGALSRRRHADEHRGVTPVVSAWLGWMVP